MTTDEQIQFGLQLKIMREERKLTQQQVSDISGFSQGSYASIETGKRNVSISVLSTILTALNCRLEIVKNED